MPDYLGIDTSNYTTSAALFHADTVKNRKKLLPVKEGEKGLRQSDAVFHHVKQLPDVLMPFLEEKTALKAIGVSAWPRTEESSYMPCFMVGKNAGEILGAALSVPVDFFSHQQGHIAAALYCAGQLPLLKKPFLAFHVSGGTTEALLVQPGEKWIPSVQIVAQSLDLKAGQAVDRVGVLLGLPFPCGPALETLAQSFQGKSVYRPSLIGNNCSLSGIENKCKTMLERGCEPAEIAWFCLDAIAVVLHAVCERLLVEYPGLPVVFSGGVCSNAMIRARLIEAFGAYFASPEFSSDNAAGVALLAKIKREGL